MNYIQKRYKIIGLFITIVLLSFCYFLFAAAPDTLTLQGIVKTVNGEPISGEYLYQIKFWDASAGGSQIGSDTEGIINLLPSGRFNINVIPPPEVLLISDVWYSLYLDIDENGIDEDDLLTGRVKLLSTLYEPGAKGKGKPIVSAPPPGQGHTHDASAIISGELPDERISDDITISSDGFIEAEAIKSGTIDDARLSVNVTLQGNTFNGPNQLVQLDSSGQLPPGIGATPKGGIIMWSGSISSIPKGWALCDGTNGTPDLRDRFIVGATQDDNGVAKTNVKGSLMITGGESQHQLTINEIPSHTHSEGKCLGSGGTTDFKGGSSENPWGSGETGSAGGGQPHENCPPFYSLAFIVKL